MGLKVRISSSMASVGLSYHLHQDSVPFPGAISKVTYILMFFPSLLMRITDLADVTFISPVNYSKTSLSVPRLPSALTFCTWNKNSSTISSFLTNHFINWRIVLLNSNLEIETNTL